jgi:S1-C subfamily serine protease
MSPAEDWSIPDTAQPQQGQMGFDLDAALAAVLQLRAEVPVDAFTAQTLGTERHGSAVLIDAKGLVVTIGYLVAEAETVWLTSHRNIAVPAHVLGYDFATGFGLLQLLGRLDLPHLPIGSSADLEPGDALVLAAGGGQRAALTTQLLAKREFAGYWEYLLDEALFTVPAHPHWGGAACIDASGHLVGIGSLLIQADGGDRGGAAGNMVVPIDLLPSVLDDVRTHGRVNRPARPWLGLYATEASERVVVVGVAPKSPAEQAGLEQGDIIEDVAGGEVADLGGFYRRIWSLGGAGVVVPMTLERDGRRLDVAIRSNDRERFLKAPRMH